MIQKGFLAPHFRKIASRGIGALDRVERLGSSASVSK